MTRKHFKALAAALNDMLLINCPNADYLAGATAAKLSIVNRIADIAASTNQRFDRAKFLAAAGLQS